RPSAAIRRELLGFSAYSFLSRFATMSYAYADKLIIGSLVGVTGLAYFSVAAALANRILSLTYRLSGVFFPAASALAARGELERLGSLYLKASRYVVFINASVLVLVAVFSYQILYYWMNPAFARAGELARKAYLPTVFGVGAVALAANAGNRLFDGGALQLVALVLVTMALLFVYGLLFVIEKDDKSLAWARLKGLRKGLSSVGRVV